MIISHSNKSIILRTPKTGSTTLETAIRMTVSIKNDMDFATVTDDSQLPEVYNCKKHEDYIKTHVEVTGNAREKIRNKIDLSDLEKSKLRHGPNYVNTDKKDLFSLPNLSHGILDDLTSKNQIWHTFDIITADQIEEYTTYAFIRNPLERILSGFVFTLERMGTNHESNVMRDRIPIGPDQLKQWINSFNPTNSLLTRFQTDYHKYEGELISTPLLFEDYKPSIDYVTKSMGGNILHELPRFKSRHGIINYMSEKPTVEKWINHYPEVRDMLCERYHEDIEMWEKLSGKKV